MVQEGRFRLTTDDARSILFVLSSKAPLQPAYLRRLAQDRTPVTVCYTEAEGLYANLAFEIREGIGSRSRRIASSVFQVARDAARNWALPRQIAGKSGTAEAAASTVREVERPRLERADKVGIGVCPFCAVGCSTLIHARADEIINIEGNPESPVNEGSLCPKGAALLDVMRSPSRLGKVKYRAPYASHWEEKPLDWAMDRIAALTKKTRDESFVEALPDGTKVNHTLAIAALGGATLDNEENYLIKKIFSGGLGMVWIENQARVCHSSSVPSLGASFGRGAATLPQWDLANSDVVVVMGSNMAENHPIAFRFALKAKQKGGMIVHVDPRFTRTSALADIYAPIRPGTDIAFLGGLIHHVLENDLWFRDYAIPYSNLGVIIEDDFKMAGDDGLFSGWDAEKQSYSFDSWQYEGLVVPSALSEHYLDTAESNSELVNRLHDRPPREDRTLQHPNCVYQILRRQYAAYTPEAVERITGCPKALFLRVAAALAENSGRERTGAFCYAGGWTHHSVGVQNIRAAAILQTLLGNVGRPGAGILALRGHCSIQGSTDIPTLYNMLPSYLPQPNAFKPQARHLEQFLDDETIPTGWWNNFPSYLTSLLRAWYGDAAGPQNEWGYHWLPKIVGDHSQLAMTLAIDDGLIRGLFLLGQNVVMGGSNSAMIQKALGKLEWLVVRDTEEVESATFWKEGNAVRSGELRPETCGTEIFLMPAELAGEKEGTFTNTHRLVQWHDKVIDGSGDNRSELWFMYHLARRLKALYADSPLPRDEPIRHVTLDYPVRGPRGDVDAAAVLREISGYTWPERRQLRSMEELRADGSTACGSWLYCGAHPGPDENRTRSRRPDPAGGPGTHLGWAFAWPKNCRTLYNRASADPDGRPWSERKRLAWWDEAEKRWTSADMVDFPDDKPPGYRPDWSAKPAGMDALRGDEPFVMMPDGRAAIFSSSGLKDGPLPVHYEPLESPVANSLHRQQSSPAAKRWIRSGNRLHRTGDPEFPYVLTTYRLTEHHCGGAPTRSAAHTAELQPEGFAEIPEELANRLHIRNLDWVTLSTARGEIETKALVTRRIQPAWIDGREVFQIGMPWHFGWRGYATGDIANVLTAVVGDPNTSMHEGKALTCNLRRGRVRRSTNQRAEEFT